MRENMQLIVALQDVFIDAFSDARNYDLIRSKIDENDYAGISEILSSGVDINSRCALTGATPLLYVAAIRDRGAMLSFLLNAGADIGAVDAKGRCAVELACSIYSVENVRVLLQNRRCCKGNGRVDFPLDRYCYRILPIAMNPDTVENERAACAITAMLLSHIRNLSTYRLSSFRSPVQCIQNLYQNAVMRAKKLRRSLRMREDDYEHWNMVKWLNEFAHMSTDRGVYSRSLTEGTAKWMNGILVKLLDNGGNINAKSNILKCETVFLMACKVCDPDAVQWLIERGADVTAENALGMNGLMLATKFENDSVVTFLLEQKIIPIDVRDYSGNTALMIAARYNSCKSMSVLMKHKANVDIVNIKGQNAYDITLDGSLYCIDGGVNQRWGVHMLLVYWTHWHESVQYIRDGQRSALRYIEEKIECLAENEQRVKTCFNSLVRKLLNVFYTKLDKIVAVVKNDYSVRVAYVSAVNFAPNVNDMWEIQSVLHNKKRRLESVQMSDRLCDSEMLKVVEQRKKIVESVNINVANNEVLHNATEKETKVAVGNTVEVCKYISRHCYERGLVKRVNLCKSIITALLEQVTELECKSQSALKLSFGFRSRGKLKDVIKTWVGLDEQDVLLEKEVLQKQFWQECKSGIIDLEKIMKTAVLPMIEGSTPSMKLAESTVEVAFKSVIRFIDTCPSCIMKNVTSKLIKCKYNMESAVSDYEARWQKLCEKKSQLFVEKYVMERCIEKPLPKKVESQIHSNSHTHARKSFKDHVCRDYFAEFMGMLMVLRNGDVNWPSRPRR